MKNVGLEIFSNMIKVYGNPWKYLSQNYIVLKHGRSQPELVLVALLLLVN